MVGSRGVGGLGKGDLWPTITYYMIYRPLCMVGGVQGCRWSRTGGPRASILHDTAPCVWLVRSRCVGGLGQGDLWTTDRQTERQTDIVYHPDVWLLWVEEVKVTKDRETHGCFTTQPNSGQL